MKDLAALLSGLSLLGCQAQTYIGRLEYVDYDTALARCAESGGQLATFTSEGQFAALLGVRIELGANSWFGFDDRDTENYWGFIDGDTSYCQAFGTGLDCDDIPQWSPGEPNNGAGNGQDCGQLYSSGRIDDDFCSYLKPFICEFEDLPPKLVASTADVIYIGQTESVDYATAKANCASFGGQLATFSSVEQFDLLLTVRNALGGGSAQSWFGFDDLETENQWKFIDGDLSYCQPFGTGLDCDDIPQWAAGEPNNGAGNGQHCGQLYTNSIDDAFCTDEKEYVCEFDPSVFAVSTGIPAVDQGNPVDSPNCQCLHECEGDCDGDNDCIGDLMCFHRNTWDDGLPAGCTGTPHFVAHDYCYDPAKAITATGPGATYLVLEVTGFQGTGGLLLVATMFVCVACLAYLAIKNYQDAHGRGKGYGKVVMESEPEM